MRRVFFGPAGDTLWHLKRLKAQRTEKRYYYARAEDRECGELPDRPNAAFTFQRVESGGGSCGARIWAIL